MKVNGPLSNRVEELTPEVSDVKAAIWKGTLPGAEEGRCVRPD